MAGVYVDLALGSKPVTSFCQAFLLNKIVIGQSMYTKYKTINKFNKTQKNDIGDGLEILLQYIFKAMVNKTVLARERMITLKSLVGYLRIGSLLWLRNFFSDVKDTLLNFEKINTTIAYKNKSGTGNANFMISSSSCTKKDKVIMQKNAKLILLLLVSKFCIDLFYCNIKPFYNHIISSINDLSKSALLICLFSNPISAMDSRELVKEITKAELEYRIPKGLLLSIATVESKLNPNSININGKSFYLKTKPEAAFLIKAALNKGITNVDVGVMQINYRWHYTKFASINEMLDPLKNIDYAAKYLLSLYMQHGSWHKAVRLYHSANPLYHRVYSRKILIKWLQQ